MLKRFLLYLVIVLVKVLNKKNDGHNDIYGGVAGLYFREFDHVFVGASKPEIHRLEKQEIQGRVDVAVLSSKSAHSLCSVFDLSENCLHSNIQTGV